MYFSTELEIPEYLKSEYNSYIEQHKLKENLYRVIEALKEKQLNDKIHLLNIPYQVNDLDEITRYADILKKFDKVVVVGTGGSTLSGQTWLKLNLSEKVIFLDNIDGFNFEKICQKIDFDNTGFLCISKSGKTTETLTLSLALLQLAKEKNIKINKHFFFLSDEKTNPFHEIANLHNCDLIKHDNVGGRFSILSNVGLIPAAICGLDIHKIRDGASQFMNDNFTSNQELLIDNILFNFVLVKLGFNMSVFMPYIERLTGISNWYRQIIAESLGKDGKGFTLIRAKGTLDQHSQLQLYLDGPKDKSFTFIKPLEIKKGLKISVPKEIKDLSYLSNKTLDGILYVEQESVIRSLRKSYMPIRQINLSKLDEETLGAILMFFMLEVICLAELYEIDAFDQPAVEFGKKLTKEMLLEKY